MENYKMSKWKKVVAVCYALAFLSILFPEYEWDEDTVLVQDEEGQDCTAGLTARELQNGVLNSSELQFELKLFSWF